MAKSKHLSAYKEAQLLVNALHQSTKKAPRELRQTLVQRLLNESVEMIVDIDAANRSRGRDRARLIERATRRKTRTDVLLDAIDQLMTRSVPVAHYGRYVDDIVMMDADIDKLRHAYVVMRDELFRIGLELHPQKTKCAPAADGFDFCGRFIKPRRTYLRRRTARRGQRAINSLNGNPHKAETLTSYFALARHCNSYRLRRSWAHKASPQGVAVSANITKARAIS